MAAQTHANFVTPTGDQSPVGDGSGGVCAVAVDGAVEVELWEAEHDAIVMTAAMAMVGERTAVYPENSIRAPAIRYSRSVSVVPP